MEVKGIIEADAAEVKFQVKNNNNTYTPCKGLKVSKRQYFGIHITRKENKEIKKRMLKRSTALGGQMKKKKL